MKFRPIPYYVISDAFAKLRIAANSFVISVRLLVRKNPGPNGQIFMKFDI
jgi:hypothetical protein